MMKNDKDEEFHSRREFFKKAARGALPILAIGLGLTSCGTGGFDELLEDWKEDPEKKPTGNGGNTNGECSDCSGGCSSTCTGGCKSSCGTECSVNCKNSCLNGCNVTCKSSCKGGCKSSCTRVTK